MFCATELNISTEKIKAKSKNGQIFFASMLLVEGKIEGENFWPKNFFSGEIF